MLNPLSFGHLGPSRAHPSFHSIAPSLSVLAEGPNSRKAMRQLSRPHAAGADRLAGLDTFDAPGNGCPVVEGAAAYLECTVRGMGARWWRGLRRTWSAR